MIRLLTALGLLVSAGASVQIFPLWQDWIFLTWITVLITWATHRPPSNEYTSHYTMLGWAHAHYCLMAEDGVDPREIEVGSVAKAMERDFGLEKQK